MKDESGQALLCSSFILHPSSFVREARMSLALACSCGKQFDVPEAHAGRRVKCPACGALMAVPAAGVGEARRSGGSRKWLWVLGLLVLAGGGTMGAIWWFSRPGPLGDGPEVP